MSLLVKVQSFSFRNGVPPDDTGHGGGFVFDVRCLPNPGRLPQFAEQSGLDRDVRQWLKGYGDVDRFLHHVKVILTQAIDNYLERDFASLSISFGCTGGQHRSVYCAELMAAHLKTYYKNRLKGTSQQVEVEVQHLCRNAWGPGNIGTPKASGAEAVPR